MTTNMSNLDRAARMIVGIVLLIFANGLHDAGNSPASNVWWAWNGVRATADGVHRLVPALYGNTASAPDGRKRRQRKRAAHMCCPPCTICGG